MAVFEPWQTTHMMDSDPLPNTSSGSNNNSKDNLASSTFSYLYGSSTNDSSQGNNTTGRDTIIASFSPHPTATAASRSSYQVTTRSPLLVATPPQVTRALSQSYPFVKAANELLGLLTWTTKDPWESFIMVCGFWAITLYGDVILRYGGLLVAVGIVGAVVAVQKRNSSDTHPSLDDILENLTTLTTRLNIFFDPIYSMLRFISTGSSATTTSTSPMLITFIIRAIIISPVWFFLSVYPFRLITTNRIVLISGTVVLSWHSRPAKVTRAILWRSRHVRLICEKATGVSFTLLPPSGIPPPLPPRKPVEIPGVPLGSSSGKRHHHHRHHKHRKSSSASPLTTLTAPPASGPIQSSISTPLAPTPSTSPGVKFTFTIYENQRRWIAIGWTSSLFAYERAPWTDEHLQPCPPPDEFKLPETQPGSGVKWRWVEGEDWWVEGADKVSGRESRLRGLKERMGKTLGKENTGGEDEGWIYYDNKWRDGRRNQDSWGRYTRRRKWYRNAELVEDDGVREDTHRPTINEEDELPDYPSSSGSSSGNESGDEEDSFHDASRGSGGEGEGAEGKGKGKENSGRPPSTLDAEPPKLPPRKESDRREGCS